jgi:hypothetical protein
MDLGDSWRNRSLNSVLELSRKIAFRPSTCGPKRASKACRCKKSALSEGVTIIAS